MRNSFLFSSFVTTTMVGNGSCDALLCSRNIIFCRARCASRAQPGLRQESWETPCGDGGLLRIRERGTAGSGSGQQRSGCRLAPPAGRSSPALHYQTNLEQPAGNPEYEGDACSHRWFPPVVESVNHPSSAQPKTIVQICRQGFMSNSK